MVNVNNAKSERVTSALSLYNTQNKDVIRRYANFIIENPNKLHVSAAAPEICSLFWNCYNKICVPADYVLIIA